MRKVLCASLGAAALACASIANAAVTVTASSGLNSPNPMAPGSVVTNDGVTTINFGQNPVSSPNFTGSFTYNNTDAGLYSFVIGSSTIGLAFTNVTLSGGGNSWNFVETAPGNPRQLNLDPVQLAADTAYTVMFTGTSPQGGALTGNVTITAVPEAATWAMMLLGFAGIGMVVRRRGKPALMQVA